MRAGRTSARCLAKRRMAVDGHAILRSSSCGRAAWSRPNALPTPLGSTARPLPTRSRVCGDPGHNGPAEGAALRRMKPWTAAQCTFGTRSRADQRPHWSTVHDSLEAPEPRSVAGEPRRLRLDLVVAWRRSRQRVIQTWLRSFSWRVGTPQSPPHEDRRRSIHPPIGHATSATPIPGLDPADFRSYHWSSRGSSNRAARSAGADASAKSMLAPDIPIL